MLAGSRRVAGRFRTLPEPSQRPREPIRLDPVRGVEVVALLEHLEREVVEGAREPLGELSVAGITG
jgi:hypothetical protein